MGGLKRHMTVERHLLARLGVHPDHSYNLFTHPYAHRHPVGTNQLESYYLPLMVLTITTRTLVGGHHCTKQQ